MSAKPSDRHSKENEKLVREANERVANASRIIFSESEVIHFHCECSNPACSARIDLLVKDYLALHKKPDHFIVTPSHENLSLEAVIVELPSYYLVDKK